MAQDTQTGYRAVRQRAPISERPAAGSRDHRVAPHCCNSEETNMSVTPINGAARVCAGIDWAKVSRITVLEVYCRTYIFSTKSTDQRECSPGIAKAQDKDYNHQ